MWYFFHNQSQVLSVTEKWNLQATSSFIEKNGLIIFTTRNKGHNKKWGRGRSLLDKTFYNENKEKYFYQTIAKELLSNFELWLS